MADTHLPPPPGDAFERRAGEIARAVVDSTGDPPHACALLLRRAVVLLELEARMPAPEPPRGPHRLAPRLWGAMREDVREYRVPHR